MTKQTVKIALGIITHRRPDMLRRLLVSIAALDIPAGAECSILIAENDASLTIMSMIDELRETVPFPISVALESESGIPFARNKVLDMAIDGGFDFLTFVDDDETVAKDWLVNLYGSISSRGLDLVGGPITYEAPKSIKLTWEHQSVLHEVCSRGHRNSDMRAAEIGQPREAEFGIYTNNWIVRIATQQRLRIRFDEDLRYTGGSDTKFYADFARVGAKTGWAPDAKVIELRPLSRLTFKYYFQRCRDQETARRLRTKKPRHRLIAIVMLGVSVIRALVYIAIAPVTQGRSCALAARALGKGVGRLKAAFGINSRHYDTIAAE